MTSKSQVVRLNQHSSPDLVERSGGISSVPVHHRLLISRVQVQDCTLEGESLSGLEECLVAHFNLWSCGEKVGFSLTAFDKRVGSVPRIKKSFFYLVHKLPGPLYETYSIQDITNRFH